MVRGNRSVRFTACSRQIKIQKQTESNLDVLADMIYGAKWYRFLLYPAPLDREFAEGLVQVILNLRK
jgi:hypothetical protein